ncbi:MAG: hypothetical protein C0463_04350 [Idiomarina sp.]|nr:hypothetical protein [Idiomarina sp.]
MATPAPPSSTDFMATGGIMEAFHFLRPWWLIGIALLIVLSPWLWRLFKQSSGWHQVLAPHLSQRLLAQQHAPSGRWFAMLASAWVITCVALAGPAWERLPTPTFQTERNAIVIMDMSLNTRATDIGPDRLTRLRFKALDLIAELEDAQIGLIAYAGDAFALSPLTRDHANIQGMLPALSPEIMPVAGNYPVRAFQEAHRMVVDAGYANAEIYWLSAGMRLDDYQEIRSFLRGKGHRVSALVAGNEERSPIRLSSGDMLRDELGRLAMAQLNSSLFQRLTREYNGRYAALRADQSDIDHLVGQGAWQDSVEDEQYQDSADQWRDRGPYLAWLLVPLAVLVMRRGVLLSIAGIGFCSMLLFPSTALASAPNSSANTDNPSVANRLARPFYNQQQRAQQAFDAGDYERAARLAQDPMLRGNAYYRGGNYGAAAEAYEQAPASPERWFNQGNTLAQLGELEASLNAFQQALAARPDWPEAEENAALIEQLLQQQESESQPNDDSQDDNSDQASQPDSGDNQGDDTQGDDSQGDDQQDSQQAEDDAQEDGADDMTNEQDADNGDEAESQEVQQQGADEPQDADNAEASAMLESALADDDLSDEERAELEQLLRRVQNDPATLLRNRMRSEAERRQQSQLPRGVRRP